MKRSRLWQVAAVMAAGLGLYLALVADRVRLASPTAASPDPAATVDAPTDSTPPALTPEPASANEPAPAIGASPARTPTTPPTPAAPPLLPGLHAATSAREALKLIALQPEGPDSVGHQRDVERLCLRARREGRRRREAGSAESWYATHLELRREWCADLPAMEGDPDSIERALLALGPDRGDVLREQLGRSAGETGQREARRALARSRDLHELTAALQHLDAIGALGVPPWSLREDLPAQIGDLAGIAAQWTLCAEAGPCGPRSWPVLRYCAERNTCPPEADFATAVRLSTSATQYEQLQWLVRRIAAERSGARRAG